MPHHTSDTAIALAALSICESLLAALLDRDLLSAEDLDELLTDAASIPGDNGNAEVAKQAARIIDQVRTALSEEGSEDEE